mgnify:CR=1 FL=1
MPTQESKVMRRPKQLFKVEDQREIATDFWLGWPCDATRLAETRARYA